MVNPVSLRRRGVLPLHSVPVRVQGYELVSMQRDPQPRGVAARLGSWVLADAPEVQAGNSGGGFDFSRPTQPRTPRCPDALLPRRP
jgi:hypothetical protein